MFKFKLAHVFTWFILSLILVFKLFLLYNKVLY